MAKDPICGKEICEKTVVAPSEYEGTTYSFCAPGCKETFDEHPEYWSSPNNYAYLWYGNM